MARFKPAHPGLAQRGMPSILRPSERC